MQYFFTIACAFFLLIGNNAVAQLPAEQIKLPNGWSLTPAGSSIMLSSDLPLNMAVSPGGNYLAVTDNGNGKQCIDLVSLKEKKLLQQSAVARAWLGLAFGKNSRYLYASGGNDNMVIRYILKGNRLINKDSILLGKPWPKENIGATGLAVDEKKHLLYAVTKENNALYVCDIKTMKPILHVGLSGKAYTCILNPKWPELYISSWGGSKAWVFDTQKKVLIDSISTESHPTDMAVSSNGKWLYVADANANAVSVINTRKREVVETLNAALYPTSLIGSTTNSVALSADNKTLYIANADNNCLAVFDVSDPGHSKPKGFIPTGWYPTGVKALGNLILVLNGKGMSSMPNSNGPQPGKKISASAYKKSNTGISAQYISNMFHGTLSLIHVPGAKALQAYTKQVYQNTPFTKQKETMAAGETNNPIPMKMGRASPIKYVFYVLKENRTYDQVLGDMPQGNGDTSLCIFGKKVTPNEHALAGEFVLLDNFYVDAEVSADGHNWSMAAYATDYVEKNWPSNYSGRGGTYDFDGGAPVANPTKGFIWDYCNRAGISFRNYGEFMDNGFPTLPVLKEKTNYCAQYPGWNLDITDVYREKIFEHDFDSLIAINAVPHFNTVYLPNDHTSGASRGDWTPIAYVADNDLALGRLVSHISHSPIWNETAIFVLEDDAQDGPDHVDAHRSTAYIASPYIKRHTVVHTAYSTSSMLRTIELVLGLPPMSQYDAAAVPMWNCFQHEPDYKPFIALPAEVDLGARNTAWDEDARQSEKFDFSRADRIPDLLLNEIVWKSVKGQQSKMPSPKRSAFVLVADKDKERD
ncbi:MAG: bifunctional YncE family protein/alkaline phosphatase family protein [Bacteroidetes bacterium]|nr:bifunctional YncE family protein/alkaline phosphatase family protein [Bacteroidota bacterium]MBS1973408.1 bifunctional YncE family protein/alkaline phosphatase family protein [Bacteroidota bacterium]